ncbi:MAG TPA: substrate-binding domain-containing protein [Thermoleophilia bacterium]|nr:substrate-binding domain-containing protein [Thermoleophilia bacterium]
MAKGRRRAGTVVLLAAAALVVFAVVGCGSPSEGPDAGQLILATTTSVKDSGLLDEVVLPAFEQVHPDMVVKTVAVGSGEAIAMGERGEADVLLVHSPKDEAAFMAAGDGTLRLPVAYNYFTVVGPRADPAGVGKTSSAADAFKAIAARGAPFVSRGDASGTNRKELVLWNAAGLTADPKAEPEAAWYLKSGQGMGETLQIAAEKGAYTLTDLATYLAMKDKLPLRPLLRKSADLKNRYSVIIVSQLQHPTVNAAGAELFAALLTSPAGQAAIGAYGRDVYGEALFIPDAGSVATAGQ